MSNEILVQATHVRKWFPIKKWFFETYPEIQDRVDKRKKRIEELVSGAA